MQQVDLEYELTEGFTAKLIRNKSKHLVGKSGIRSSDRDDIEQDMRIKLYGKLAKFDPQKANWEAFATTVVNSHIASMLEKRRAKKRNNGIPPVSFSELEEEDHPLWDGGIGAIEEDLDFEVMLEQIPEEMHETVHRLRYESISKVARDLGISRSTLQNRLIRLRKKLQRSPFSKNK